MAVQRHIGEIRIALIGLTGCGKSALGNTLLGFPKFKSSPAGQGEFRTQHCEEGRGTLPSGQIIKVIDTPGVDCTEIPGAGREIAKSIAYLSPGPHAFLITLSPNRVTQEETLFITKLIEIFGDETFFRHSLIVMLRRNDIRDADDKCMDIHQFINELAQKEVKLLYKKCNKRIVAVDNLESAETKARYREEVVNQIRAMDGFYSSEYFTLKQQQKLQDKQEQELKMALKKSSDSSCSIQ